MTVDKIISGGQTGVDRAALDAAIRLGIPHGGYCPRGRRAEDARIADCYLLAETPASDYLQRTEWNVRDSDGTLILTAGPLEGGTAATARFASLMHKPCLIIDLSTSPSPEAASQWLKKNAVRVLNVAGPRASKQPAIYEQAVAYLDRLLRT